MSNRNTCVLIIMGTFIWNSIEWIAFNFHIWTSLKGCDFLHRYPLNSFQFYCTERKELKNKTCMLFPIFLRQWTNYTFYNRFNDILLYTPFDPYHPSFISPPPLNKWSNTFYLSHFFFSPRAKKWKKIVIELKVVLVEHGSCIKCFIIICNINPLYRR